MTNNPRNPLDYRGPLPEDPAGDVGKVGQLALGCASSLLLMVASAFLFAAVASLFQVRSDGVAWTIVLLIIIGDIAGLIFLANHAKNRWRWNSFIPGLILGFLLPILGVGLCFAIVLVSVG